MDYLFLVYVILTMTVFFGAKAYKRGEWNDGFLSLPQVKVIQGVMTIFILFHHMSQKAGAPYHPAKYIIHGLDVFVEFGYFFVAVFLFCSGYGLYRSFHEKQDYLKGFFKKRVLPVVLTFYLTEWIFLALRFVMGEKMDVKKIVHYIIGSRQANEYAWYAIAIPLFYLFFYLAFRFCKKDGLAILLTGVGIFAYTVLGLFVDHNDYLMRGEWWYNTAHMFFIGLVFAKFEKPIIAHIKKFYPIYLVIAIAGMVFFFKFSMYATGTWSYYGESFDPEHKVIRRVGCLLTQMGGSTAFTAVIFLSMMKIRLDNAVLRFFGRITLEFYLIHGIFVELFGYNFLDVADSLYYIKNIPLYVLVVVACSIPAAMLVKLILQPINKRLKSS